MALALAGAILAAAVFPALRVFAEDSFLGVEFGGRALAMGGAYTAVADDAQGVLWNPAGIAQVSSVLLSGSQNHLSFTENAFSLTLAMPAGGSSGAALSIQQMNVDNIAKVRPVLDANGNPVLDPFTNEPLLEISGFGEETDASFILGYGAELAPWMMAGAAGKALVGNSASVIGTGYGINLGALARFGKAWKAGLTAEDLGTTTVRWEGGARTSLEPSFRTGVAWNPAPEWIFSGELGSPFHKLDMKTALGAEWRFTDVLAVRAGLADMRFSGGAGFVMALGEGASRVIADYAIVTGGRFEDRNRLTVTVGF